MPPPGPATLSDMTRTCLLIFCAVSTLAAQDGRITTSGSPNSAGVFIDGKYAGPAARYSVHRSYAATAGEHEVIIREPRYEEYRTKVTVRPGKSAKVKYTLKKLPEPTGQLGELKLGGGSYGMRIDSDRGAVYLNGQFMGHVDEFNHPGAGLMVPAGAYELKVVSEEFGEINRRVTIEPGKTTVINMKSK